MLLSIMGITLEEIDLNASLPINPTIIRIMRVLRITRGWLTRSRRVQVMTLNDADPFASVSVLKLLKMATGMRSLLDTVIQALPQVKRSAGAENRKMFPTSLKSQSRYFEVPEEIFPHWRVSNLNPNSLHTCILILRA